MNASNCKIADIFIPKAMAAIGSLVFCTDCGNLLDGSSGDEKAILKCDVCGTENRGVAPATTSQDRILQRR